MPTLTTTIQHSFGSFRHSSQRRKINKRNPNWKKKIKLSPFADVMILYIENHKGATRKLLELINEFGKVGAYKVNTKSVAFLYTKHKRSEGEIQETILFTIASKRIKCLGIN